MMKKVLFLIVATFICSTISAQLVTASEYKVKKEKSSTIWMLRAGLTMPSASGSDADKAGSYAGYNVSIEFNKPISSGVYWGSGLVFGNKGYKFSEGDYEDKLATAKLELPVNFGYKYALTDEIQLDGHIGGFINYDLFGKETVSEGDESLEAKIGDMDSYNRLGYGLQFGIGVWYQKLNFNITYQKGLAKMWEDTKIYESNWMLSIGYAF